MSAARFAAVLAFVVLAAARVAAQDSFVQWIRPEFGDKELQTAYEAMHYFDADVFGRSQSMRFTRHDFKLSFPIHQDKSNEWQFSAGANSLDVSGNARLPDTRDHFPSHLWDVRVGTTYRHRFDNGVILGGNLTISSPSDRPFEDADELVIDFTGVLRFHTKSLPPIVILLNYTNVRERCRNFPMLGFGIQFAAPKSVPGLGGMLGVPFNAIEYERGKFRFEAVYVIPQTVHAQVFYRLFEPLRVYGGFEWGSQWWLRHDRKHIDDLLTSYEKRVMAGVEWTICENVTLDLGGGFAWDRFFYEGEDYGDRGDNRIDLHDGWFARAAVRLRF